MRPPEYVGEEKLMTIDTPRTAAGRRLLEQLRKTGWTLDAAPILAIEAEAAAGAKALLSELVTAGEVVPPRGSPGWRPPDVRVRAWENAQKKARRFLAAR